ncbi:nucleolar protein 12 [Histomonas meleagridis]|uniref:nucleolar protein 12 n=1 Tax=Histomonas meleagridis TaxID=135588 RepID=UPI00355A1223|nr:nucleolar protein 12 [Histomonas meleagridis]KAH0802298.1 nucleolar protein 12 [Histomonas meleagridis]
MSEKDSLDDFFATSNPSKLLDRFLGKETLEVEPDLIEEDQRGFKHGMVLNQVDEAERLTRTVFIGNLPASIKSQEIKKLFTPTSIVESIRIRNIPIDTKSKLSRKVAVRRHEINQAGTCSAYVVLKSNDNIDEYINKINGSTHFDHVLRADHAKAAGEKSKIDKDTNKRTVFIGHVPFDATEEEVIEIFKSCGDIHHVRIPHDERGRSRGVAYVTFQEEDSVPLALKFNQAKFKNETIIVQRSNPEKAKKMKEKTQRNEKKKEKKENTKIQSKKEKPNKKQKKSSFEGKRAKAREDDGNQAIKTYLKMRAHIRKKKLEKKNK